MKKRKNEAAVALGSLGGKARAKKLTPQRRKQIATKASKAAAKVLTAAKRRQIAMLGVAARRAKKRRKT